MSEETLTPEADHAAGRAPLMGFPIGWSEIEALETPSLQTLPSGSAGE